MSIDSLGSGKVKKQKHDSKETHFKKDSIASLHDVNNQTRRTSISTQSGKKIFLSQFLPEFSLYI